MDTEHEAALAALETEYPAYRFTLETAVAGPRYVVRSRDLNQHPHTLITRNLAELRATLAAAQPPAQGSPPVLRC